MVSILRGGQNCTYYTIYFGEVAKIVHIMPVVCQDQRYCMGCSSHPRTSVRGPLFPLGGGCLSLARLNESAPITLWSSTHHVFILKQSWNSLTLFGLCLRIFLNFSHKLYHNFPPKDSRNISLLREVNSSIDFQLSLRAAIPIPFSHPMCVTVIAFDGITLPYLTSNWDDSCQNFSVTFVLLAALLGDLVPEANFLRCVLHKRCKRWGSVSLPLGDVNSVFPPHNIYIYI